MRATDIIVRRNITSKLEAAFSAELALLPDEMRSILLDDLTTALIERMNVFSAIAKIDTDEDPIEATE